MTDRKIQLVAGTDLIAAHDMEETDAGRRLVRAFLAIKSPEKREELIELAEAMQRSEKE